MLLWDKNKHSKKKKKIKSREVNLTDDVDAQLYVTKVSTISLYLRKLFVTWSLAIASSVKYSEIRQNFSKSESVGTRIIKCQGCQHIYIMYVKILNLQTILTEPRRAPSCRGPHLPPCSPRTAGHRGRLGPGSVAQENENLKFSWG